MSLSWRALESTAGRCKSLSLAFWGQNRVLYGLETWQGIVPSSRNHVGTWGLQVDYQVTSAVLGVPQMCPLPTAPSPTLMTHSRSGVSKNTLQSPAYLPKVLCTCFFQWLEKSWQKHFYVARWYIKVVQCWIARDIKLSESLALHITCGYWRDNLQLVSSLTRTVYSDEQCNI